MKELPYGGKVAVVAIAAMLGGGIGAGAVNTIYHEDHKPPPGHSRPHDGPPPGWGGRGGPPDRAGQTPPDEGPQAPSDGTGSATGEFSPPRELPREELPPPNREELPETPR